MREIAAEPILYTQTGCAESVKVRTWLTDHRISFTERNASVDPEAAQALAATGTFATPLLVLGQKNVLGFRPEALAAALPMPGDAVRPLLR
jgi:glutaredoxin-like protein NrdH